MTKDERFLVEIFKAQKASGKPIVNASKVAGQIGLSPHQEKVLLKGLFQANFLKKEGEGVILTSLGLNLAHSLL